MAIPTGAGTEVLKRASLRNNSNAWTAILTGASADHIYTILSVTWMREATSAVDIGMRVDISSAGSNQVGLLDYHTNLPGYGTFTWNDKFVLSGTDKLDVYSAGNCDIYVSYIDQHF
jgi:hypothetical protein